MNSIKIPATFLAAGAALCLMVQPLSALTFGKFTYSDRGNYISIDGYPTNGSGDVVIPQTIADKPVTAIGEAAFEYCNGLTSVTIPNSVTSIGDSAFGSCSGLTSVTISNGVISIGAFAFSSCLGLTSFTIPNSVTSIGEGAFGNCGLTSVTISNGVTSIGAFAFNTCLRLTSLTISNSVTSIGEGAFGSCGRLNSATFLGNAPLMGTSVFLFAKPNFMVYYLQGKKGFTSPIWNGYQCVAIGPEIDVQQPVGTVLVDSASKKNFGKATVGMSGSTKTFTIKNTGTADLKNLVITKEGTNAGSFKVTAPLQNSLAPGTSTTFRVTFKPSAAGTRKAAIHIKNNDADESPFDIKLTGEGVAP